MSFSGTTGGLWSPGPHHQRARQRHRHHRRRRVSTDFIYRHPPLRSEVEALRRARNRPAPGGPGQDPDANAAASTLVRRLPANSPAAATATNSPSSAAPSKPPTASCSPCAAPPAP